VPYRERYLASLIRLSLVSVGDETQLLVYREGQQTVCFGRTAAVKNLTDLSDLLRDAAFMILQLHGKVLEARNWLSMRCFADGLDSLDEFRRAGRQELLDKAKKSFGRAAEAEPDNYDALYFYGSMLLIERSRESIAAAAKLFTQALKTEKRKLRALVNTGLANCYAQQFHRLAKRETDVLAIARKYAQEARLEWLKAMHSEQARQKGEEAISLEHLHPWILSTLALVRIVDEGADATAEREKAKKRFLDSAPFLVQAIEMEPDNGTFHNNLGWLLLKLAEWRLQDINGLKLNEDVPADLSGTPPKAAEYYLLRALELNPKNKLSHANLCLLYATPHYREQEKEEEEERRKNLIRCRYHGLKAIRLDPRYINGHRDLALSLIRYGELDDAYDYFVDALRLALTVEKDQEIIDDALRILKEMQVPGEEWERWRHPDLSLLMPPEKSSS
jgi:Tfp pilus assembly protein PilF